jgi:hypothetical protein
MHAKEVVTLLTQEYSLVLATNKNDITYIKNIRKDVFNFRYSIYPDLQNSQWYLFGPDDEQSFIYLLRHNTSNTYVGTVRSFFINNQTPIKSLPMQKDGHVDDIYHLTKNYPIVEISRGALIKELPPHTKISALKLRTILTYGLMVATRINFLLYPYKMVFSIMERPLHRILKRQKVNFVQVGEPVEYYGIRIPYALKRETLVQDTEELMGEVTRYYLKELCKNPESFWQFVDSNPYLKRSDMQLDRICQLFKEHGDDVDIALLLEKETS